MSYTSSTTGTAQPYTTYTFANAFYFQDFPPATPTSVLTSSTPDRAEAPPLRSATYRQRATPNDYGVAPKSFVDPRHCLSVFNHYCWVPLRTAMSSWRRAVHVKASVALSHHYRKCTFGVKKCAAYFQQRTVDDAALRFRDELKPRVTRVLRLLGADLEEPVSAR